PYLNHLNLSSTQISMIRQLYKEQRTFVEVYQSDESSSSTLSSQLEAATLHAENGRSVTEPVGLGSRWKKKWSTRWIKGKGKLTRLKKDGGRGTASGPKSDGGHHQENSSLERVLFQWQAQSGYYSEHRQINEHLKANAAKPSTSTSQNQSKGKKQRAKTSNLSPRSEAAERLVTVLKGKWKRHAPFDFVGCLAHVDITFQSSNGQILRIVGYLNHNDACQRASMARSPPVPLHPHVYRVALQQLLVGANLYSIKTNNRKMIDQRLYHGMEGDPSQWNFRYLILRSDSSRLYRMLSRHHGITTKTPAEINIHLWLDPTSKQFQPTLHKARFTACIASEEMEEATWKYGHQSQIILDGTFGLCDSPVLLFVVMGVDENGHGVPLCFMLFYAPTRNRQTSAGYDTEVLTDLLQNWANWLASRGGRSFEPFVAITDTDTKERGALLIVFPGIILLLCKFHLRQCWTNRRRQLLGPIEGLDFAKQQVKSELQALEMK
ncbi:hypothetical protein FRB90_005669, partial [Tulasnella sp. 427]